MGLLNRPSDGLPSVGIAVTKLLASHGPRTADDIRSLCDPPGLNNDDDSMVLKTLKRWVQLGVFCEVEDKIGLGQELDGANLFSEDDPLREALRWRILKSHFRTTSEPIEESPAGDFLAAAWWLLRLDPTRICLDSDEAAIREAERSFPGKTVIQNDTRWQGLLDWVGFLGLGTTLKGALIPNPTAAVRWAMSEAMFQEGRTRPAFEFIQDLEAAIPLLGHGHVARAAARYFTTAPGSDTGTHRVPPVLSLALLSLRGEGLLEFEGREDSQSLILLQEPGGGESRVEKITLRKKCPWLT